MPLPQLDLLPDDVRNATRANQSSQATEPQPANLLDRSLLKHLNSIRPAVYDEAKERKRQRLHIANAFNFSVDDELHALRPSQEQVEHWLTEDVKGNEPILTEIGFGIAHSYREGSGRQETDSSGKRVDCGKPDFGHAMVLLSPVPADEVNQEPVLAVEVQQNVELMDAFSRIEICFMDSPPARAPRTVYQLSHKAVPANIERPTRLTKMCTIIVSAAHPQSVPLRKLTDTTARSDSPSRISASSPQVLSSGIQLVGIRLRGVRLSFP